MLRLACTSTAGSASVSQMNPFKEFHLIRFIPQRATSTICRLVATSQLVGACIFHSNSALTRMRIGPSCRTPISKDRLFIREAFEPTDEELIVQPKEGPVRAIKKSVDDDDEMPDIREFFGSPVSEVKPKASAAKKEGKGKGKAKLDRKPRPGRSQKKRRVMDSEDEGGADDIDMDEDESVDGYEDSDLSDFIVHTDEDEDEKDARKASKRLMKRRATTPIESEESDDDKIILGRKRPIKDLPGSAGKGPIKLLSRMLPSTKMLVRDLQLESCKSSRNNL